MVPSAAHAPPFADDDPLLAALRKLGHSEFRPGQRSVVEAVMSGADTVAIMPTGGGKSLCYQLPSLLLPGVTVVVSPLIALMRDQVAALTARGIAATFVNSTLTQAEREDRQQNLSRYRLVYVAPERFRSPRFCEALSRVPLALLAVDEAHCISEWGHDFRPDYRRLGEVAEQLRPPRLLALTATATPEVRGDIVKQLKLQTPSVFVHGFDRPNLDLIAERAGGDKDKLQRALRLLCATQSGVAIVYTATRKKAVAVAEGLCASGLLARPYHAGLPDEERRATEIAFLGGDLPIIVATNAFGMGIDKRDVRLVLHHDLPRSPEAYYQEAGRAGRDGARAQCVLLFNPGDARVQEFLIEQSSPDPHSFRRIYERIADLGPVGEDAVRAAIPGASNMMVDAVLRALLQSGAITDEDGAGYRVSGPLRWDEAALSLRQEREKQKLRRMVSYGFHGGCRMRFFLDYFGDHFRDAQHGTAGPGAERTRCGFCDNCQRFTGVPLSAEDQLVVRKALAGVARMDGRFGRRRVAEVLKGHASEEVQRAGLDQLSTFGILADRSLIWLGDLLTTLEGAGLIGNSGGEYPTVRLLPAGREVMHDRQKAQLALPAEAPAPVARGKRGPRIQNKLRSSGAARLAGADTEAKIDEAEHPLSPPQPAAQARARAALGKPTPQRPGRGASADATDDDLPLTAEQEARFARLRQIRSELARDAKVAPFIVFHDRTLRALARSCPRDRAALGRIPGIGDNKLQRYGEKVLKALREG